MKKYIISLWFGAVLIAPFWTYAQINVETIAALQAQLKVLMEKVQQLQASQSQAQSGAGGVAGGSGSAGSPTLLSVPMPNMPPFPPPDFDDDFDDIVQFNNLIVRSVSGPSFPAEIKASYEVGVRCQKFQSESASGVEYPCPLSPSVLYTIQLDSDTRLLLRNRQRASLSDFEVGNRINVYGFTNSGVSSIDALVVRNLTKPVRLSFIQLNNMEVLSAPSSGVPPASFTVVNKYFSPCRDFSDNPNSGVTLPCPMGLEIQEQPQPGAGAMGASPDYYPAIRKYLIEVTSQTAILQRDRTSMALSEIAVGDILNIYGSYTNSSQNIKALIIRDLSRPAQNYGSLQVSVNGMNIMCVLSSSSLQQIQSGGSGGGHSDGGPSIILPPCGTIYHATVDLYDASGTLIGTQTTERGVAFFENLRAGEYTIVASAKGYDKNKTDVSIGAGRVTFATINLSQFEVPPPFPTPFPTPPPINNQAPVISGVKGPTALKVGETGTWSVSAYDPENGPLSYSVVWGDEAVQPMPSPSPVPLSLAPVQQTATFTHSYANSRVYTPVFYVTDNQGLIAKTSMTVTIDPSARFQIGDRVKTTAIVNVRGTPSLSNFASPIRGTQAVGALGTISPSPLNLATYPIYVNGYWWWYIDFDSGADGWVTENYLEKFYTQPSITVTVPNGHAWQSGTNQTIQWTDSAYASNVYYTVFAVRKDGGAYGIIANQVYGTSFVWNVGTLYDGKLGPLAPGETSYYIQIVRQTAPSVSSSNSPFSIMAPTPVPIIIINAADLPTGTVGVAYPQPNITASGIGSDAKWTAIGLPPGLTISTSPVSCNSAGSCSTNGVIFGTPTAVGTYTFTVTVTSGGKSASKQFQITVNQPTSQPSITVLSPNGGETYYKGNGKDGIIFAKWTTSGVSSSAVLDLIRLRGYDNGVEYYLINNTINDGYEEIPIPSSIPDGAYTLEIKSSYNSLTLFDGSDSYFKIVTAATQPSITVLSPNGGEQFQIGAAQPITWIGSFGKTYAISVVDKNGFGQGNIATVKGIAADKQVFSWPVGQVIVASDQGNLQRVLSPGDYKILILETETGNSDMSNAPFSIVSLQSSYPGFFMKLDKSTYAPTDTLVLTSSRADGKTAYYPVDIYAVRNKDNVRTLIQASASIALNTNTYIFLNRWGIFNEGGAGDYLILFCDASKECVGGVNTNSVGFSIVVASSGGGGGGGGGGSILLAPNSSQTASLAEALRILTEDLNKLLSIIR
ncbi:MAG: putative Ig domain-containing protein [Candidatus Sungbacteria bacterium]|nr:putative Ig domain-containing protein [Candidatus Sungbacteria bacterium]